MGCISFKSKGKTSPPPSPRKVPRPRISAEFKEDYSFKFLIVGNPGVGKSSLLLRFVDNTFTDTSIPTIGADFKDKIFSAGEYLVKLQIWDVAGQEKYTSPTSSYFRGHQGIIICYDITRHDSFTAIERWLKQIERYGSKDVHVAIAACKGDLENQRAVRSEEADKFCDRRNLDHFVTSAQSGSGVSEIFSKMASAIVATLEE